MHPMRFNRYYMPYYEHDTTRMFRTHSIAFTMTLTESLDPTELDPCHLAGITIHALMRPQRYAAGWRV